MGKIYTRSGDRGLTSLIGGLRLAKTDPVFEFLGDLDELGAQLGVACSHKLSKKVEKNLRRIQADLLTIGAQVAGARQVALQRPRTRELEELIDYCFELAGPLTNFVLANGTAGATHLYLARAIARRAERKFCQIEFEDEQVLTYLNRLSDSLFALARLENKLAGRREIEWHYEGN